MSQQVQKEQFKQLIINKLIDHGVLSNNLNKVFFPDFKVHV